MGLDMYLYLRKKDYSSTCRGECPYPEELAKFSEDISNRNFRSIEVTTDYQIGYWRKSWDIYSAIKSCVYDYENGYLEIDYSEAQKIVEAMDDRLKKGFPDTEEGKINEEDAKYTKRLFQDAIRFLDAHPYVFNKPEWSIVYYSSY